MKKIFLTLCLVAMGIVAMAQQAATVLSSTNSQVQIRFSAPKPTVETVTLSGETFCTVAMQNYLSATTVGKPSLPSYNAMIEVPQGATLRVTVERNATTSLTSQELGVKHLVAPAQPSRSKSDTSSRRLVIDRTLYSQNAFYGNDMVSIEEIGTARDTRLALVSFSPMTYNPVSGTFTLCREAVVTVHFDGADLTATRQLKQRHHSNAFTLGSQMLSTLPVTKAVRTTAPIRMLIVSDAMFRGQLDEFVQWKQRKGYLTDIVYTDSIGTSTTAISNYINNQYTNATEQLPAPTYVILVGDHQQIPAFAGRDNSGYGHVTDLYYATWTAGDAIPDCYIGRFSAQSVSQLIPQLQKTLMYEQYTFPDPSFLDKAVLVAGVDRGYEGDHGYTHGDPTLDFAAKNYVNGNNGFSQVLYFKNKTSVNPNALNVTVNSNSNTAAVRNAYNEGAGWINYTAHGDWDEWSIPEFNTNHVAAMTNTYKFGFMIGNCCLTGKFNENKCYAEALLRKDNYCGAVNYIGCSDVSYWNEDVYWSMGLRSSIGANMSTNYNSTNWGMYDRLFHTHGEPFAEQYYTAGAMMMAGNMAVQSSSSSFRTYYWEIYHCFGDPSVSPWLTQPEVMSCSVPSTVISGTAVFNATVVPNAYVAITKGDDHQFLAAAYADNNGNVSIPLAVPFTPGTYEVAVSAQQYQTLLQPLLCIAPNGPYLLTTDIQVLGSCKVGDTVRLSMKVANLGNATANGGHILLQTDSTAVLPLNVDAYIDALPAGDTVELTGLFPMAIRQGLSDQSLSRFALATTWNGCDEAAVTNKSFKVNAPKVELSYTLQKTNVMAGDSVRLQVNLTNNGHADMSNAAIEVASAFPLLSVTNGGYRTAVAAGQTQTLSTFVKVDSRMVEGVMVPLYFTAGNYFYNAADSVLLYVGEPTVEDFEAGDFSRFAWQQGNNPWQVVNSGAYAGTYCAKSGNISHSQTTSFTLTVNATRADSISFFYKVSSETNYDKFNFYIDNQQQLSQSGEVEWTKAIFPVNAGSHTFKFEYKKDYSTVGGSDCAWLDNIALPSSDSRTYQLVSDTICLNEVYTFHGTTLSTATAGQTLYTDTIGNVVTQLCLTVVETPQVSIEADATSVVKGESLWLYAQGADRYEWSTGETTDSIYVTPYTATLYTVEGFRGTCSATASINITVGIDEVENAANINVYPNPAHDFVTVQADNLQRVELYNTLGQRLQTSVANATLRLSLQGLPTGSYYLRIVTATGSHLRQVIVR